MSLSAFGIDHGDIYKAEDPNRKKKQAAAAAGGTAAVGGVGLAATKIPEHSHYDKKTRKYLHSLPAGEHEVPTAMLGKRPRKLGARKQQAPYVAAMAQERPLESFHASPVPITRYKGKGHPTIQRDNAHTVMANAMKGRTTRIKIEDAPGYRPNRRTADELVRRGQSKYQQRRLRLHTNLSEKAIEGIRGKYTDKSRAANTAKRPHGVVEESLKYNPKKYGVGRAVGRAKNLAAVVKRDRRGRDTAAGVTGAAGVGTLASTPVRRSAAKVDVSGGSMSASDAKKVVSPGYRPGNKRAIRTMAANLGHLENKPTTVVRYKSGHVVPFDGNHRASARVARGDARVPVNVIEGGERPAISAARNAFHVGQQKVHRNRMDRDVFKPNARIGRHAGETKAYRSIANASPLRSGKRVAVGSTKIGSGPTKAVLRTKQGATLAAGAALLGTSAHLHRKKS